MAAGLGFKDFTTGEVLTASDVDGYLMQGIWVFANSTARDAAVTSPQEGNFAFLKDTNTTTYYTGSAWTNLDTTGMVNPMTTTGDTIYSSSGSTPARLGIGTAGQVLQVNSGATAPEWATPGGSDFVRITTSSFSSSTAVNIDSCFSTTYDNYRILFNVTALASSPNSLNLRFRTSGSTNTTSNYGSGFRYAAYGTGTAGGGGSALSSTSAYLGDYSNAQAATVLDILNPFASQKTHVVYLHNLASGYAFNGGALFDTTTSFDGIALYPDVGNITGTVSVYGYKKA